MKEHVSRSRIVLALALAAACLGSPAQAQNRGNDPGLGALRDDVQQLTRVVERLTQRVEQMSKQVERQSQDVEALRKLFEKQSRDISIKGNKIQGN